MLIANKVVIMGNEILVSVIVPVYNVESYLDRCLGSIVNQTLKNIEIIIVDDGSPDNCPSMCDRWAKRDNRIKVIHKKNAGLGFARNSGLDVAKGEYVIFCDSDDSVDSVMYESLYNATENGKYDVVYSGFNQEMETGKWQKCNNYPDVRTFDEKFSERVAMSFISETDITCGHRYVMSCNVAMYKRQLLDTYHIRQMSERVVLSEDMIFQLQVALHGKNFKFVPDCYYHYYINGASLTHTFKKSKLTAAFKIHELMTELMPKSGYNTPRIDYEFYSRIRSLFTQMVCGSNLSCTEKYAVAKQVSSMLVLIKLDDSIIRQKSWKYGAVLVLLKKNLPFFAILFTYFDRYVNKQRLLFWK